jgi:hypothetical protein
MKTKTVEAFDWQEDVEPELLKNLNELLVAKNVEPMDQLHGGAFLDGKWVSISETRDYRNYWHAYIELWGEKLHNDSYQTMWFPAHDDDEEWEYCRDRLREWSASPTNGHKHVDPNWTDDLVTSMRKVVKEHFPYDERVVFWWCW